jgi:N-formylglutamate amidohydrolase
MLYDFRSGSAPLLVDVPHAGTEVPPGIAERLSERAAILPDTDWHVHRLVEGAPRQGAARMEARVSRYVIDLNRGRDDEPLYAGPTTGLVPTRNFDGSAVYRDREPTGPEIAERVERYWRPYHDKLRHELEALRDRHGHVVLLDLHSIRSRVHRLFEGRLPDLNLGTYDGRSCAPDLEDAVAERLAGASGFSTVVNGRFKGGYITRHYGRPNEGIHALQLEIAQACYLDESQPEAFDPQAARPLVELIEALLGDLADWRPT